MNLKRIKCFFNGCIIKSERAQGETFYSCPVCEKESRESGDFYLESFSYRHNFLCEKLKEVGIFVLYSIVLILVISFLFFMIGYIIMYLDGLETTNSECIEFAKLNKLEYLENEILGCVIKYNNMYLPYEAFPEVLFNG